MTPRASQRRKTPQFRRFVIQWHITDRCPSRCRHCYGPDARQPDPPLAELLALFDSIRAFLDRQNAGPRGPVRGRLTLTGGEPLLHPDFWTLAAAAAGAREQMDFAVLTSGQGLERADAARLAALAPAFVQISLDGGRESHDALRGEGRFEAAVQAAERLVRAGARTFLAFTAHQGNYREIGAVARLGRELRVAKVWADRFVPLLSGVAHGPRALRPEQTQEFCGLLRDAARRVGPRSATRIAAERGLQFLATGGRPYACEAGRSLLTLLPNGDILPCRRMPVRVGNAHGAPLHEVYETSPFLQALRVHGSAPECAPCAYRLGCRGGSLCQAYARFGEELGRDPGCWLEFAPLPQ